jgi:hypothetical protein
MTNRLDVLFINPDSSAKADQGLAAVFSAIEPPTWALLLAESCRSKNFSVAILDCDAERLTVEKLAEKKFGHTQRMNIEEMASIRLKRKIMGD